MSKLTVQKLEKLVPATFGSGQAGSQSSYPRPQCFGCGQLRHRGILATSNLDLEKQMFKRGRMLPRTLETRPNQDERKVVRWAAKMVSTPTAIIKEGRQQEIIQDQEKVPVMRISSTLTSPISISNPKYPKGQSTAEDNTFQR